MSRGRQKYGVRVDGVGSFGEWLVRELRENDMTCADFAGLLRTSRQSITAYILHKTKPSYITVIAICHILNRNPVAIWRLVEEDWG